MQYLLTNIRHSICTRTHTLNTIKLLYHLLQSNLQCILSGPFSQITPNATMCLQSKDNSYIYVNWHLKKKPTSWRCIIIYSHKFKPSFHIYETYIQRSAFDWTSKRSYTSNICAKRVYYSENE